MLVILYVWRDMRKDMQRDEMQQIYPARLKSGT